jgi:hypothetical protein
LQSHTKPIKQTRSTIRGWNCALKIKKKWKKYWGFGGDWVFGEKEKKWGNGDQWWRYGSAVEVGGSAVEVVGDQ